MKIAALLPMKAHSERVPGKNIRLFAGKPLFLHVLETVLASQYIESVFINTDSPEIARIAGEFRRVTTIIRPAELRGDFVSMNAIIAHDLSILPNYDHFLQTHSTNPLLSVKTLDMAIAEYFNNLSKFDSLFSVTPIQSRLYDCDGPINHNPAILERTQDLSPVYEENSNIYVFSKASFRNADCQRIGLFPKMFPMSRIEAMDIDQPEDFILAETLYHMQNSKLTGNTFNSLEG